MNEAKTRTARIRDKIAASQARLSRDNADLPEAPPVAPLPDAYPPESYRSLAGEYPWLAVAAGAGVGLLLGAALPRAFGGRIGRRALAAATVAGELGLALSKQAREAAGDAASDGLDYADEKTAPLRQNARRMAGVASGQARSAGLLIAREAIGLAARLGNRGR